MAKPRPRDSRYKRAAAAAYTALPTTPHTPMHTPQGEGLSDSVSLYTLSVSLVHALAVLSGGAAGRYQRGYVPSLSQTCEARAAKAVTQARERVAPRCGGQGGVRVPPRQPHYSLRGFDSSAGGSLFDYSRSTTAAAMSLY